MPSNPTTLAELVARLEAEAARERYLGIYGDGADLMERAAKVLRALDRDCAVVEGTWYSPDEITGAAVKAFVTRVRVSITRALGGSDGA